MRYWILFIVGCLCSHSVYSAHLDDMDLYPDSAYSEFLERSLHEDELTESHIFGDYTGYYHFEAPHTDTWCFGGKQGADVKTQVFHLPQGSQVRIHNGAEVPFDQIYSKSVNCFPMRSGDTLHLVGHSHTSSISEIPVSVRSSQLTISYSQHMFNLLTLYFGFIFAFIIIHIMFGFFSRFTPSYWYAFFLLSFGLTSMLYANMESLIFDSSSPLIQSDIPLMVSLTIWSLTGFTLNYFRNQPLSNLMKFAILGLPCFHLVINLLASFTPHIINDALMLEAFIFQVIIVLIAAITSKPNKRSYKKMFIIGWSVFICGFVIFTLNEIYPNGSTMVAMYSTTLGHIFEMMLFTLFFGLQIVDQEKAAARALKKSRRLANHLLKQSAEMLPGQLSTIRAVDPSWDFESKKIWEISANRLELSLNQIRAVSGIYEEQHNWYLQNWVKELSENFYNAYLAQRTGSQFKIQSLLVEDPQEIPDRLHLATQIVLDNAFKFSKDKKVLLVIKRADHNLVIEVHDDGPGFPREILSQYHTAFWQESTGLTRSHQGLGLGFKVISELLSPVTAKWELGQSPELGGALFSIIYPVNWTGDAVEPFNKELTYSADLNFSQASEKSNKDRFLIVDDNMINLKVLAKMLNKIGYEYDMAENGQQALELYEENPEYIGVFMDLQMPIMDGFESTKQMRAFESQCDIEPTPIVAITAHSGPETKSQCLEVGMQDMLAKPVKLFQIEKIVHRILNQYAPEPEAPEPPPNSISPHPFNLLVVDDNLVNRKVLCKMANKLGFETIQAENGQEAFEFYTQQYQFCAVLMDLQMPVVDGFEATKQIRYWEHNLGIDNIPIIAVTAHSGPETLQQCLSSGMQAMISKPFKMEKLEQVFKAHQIKIPEIEKL